MSLHLQRTCMLALAMSSPLTIGCAAADPLSTRTRDDSGAPAAEASVETGGSGATGGSGGETSSSGGATGSGGDTGTGGDTGAAGSPPDPAASLPFAMDTYFIPS